VSTARFTAVLVSEGGGPPPPPASGVAPGGWEWPVIIYTFENTAVRRRVPFFLVDEDGDPATAENDGQPQISKNWGSWVNTTNKLVGGTNGGYYVELTTSEIDTLGVHRLRYASANASERQVLIQVVAYDLYNASYLGVTALATMYSTISPPSQGAPPSAATIAQILSYLYLYWRNKVIVTGTVASVYNDAGDTVLFKLPLSADSEQTTFTKDEIVTGP